ncbi:MAG: hypothetical protein KF819_23795 [Labilithrix sp.]|nr:hypothetical protein [Labilithrix sp.]
MDGPRTLESDIVVRGVTIPAGSTFHDEEPFDHRIFVLSRSTVVHGARVAKGGTLEVWPFPPPVSVVVSALLLPLYPWFAWRTYRDVVAPARFGVEPVEPLIVDGVEIRAGDRVWLERRGIASLTIGSPRVIEGHALETGTVMFATGGRPRSVILYRSQALGGLPCFGSGLVGTDVLLDEAGRVRRCVLSEDALVDGRRYARGTRLDLDESGRVRATKAMNVDVALYTPRPDVMNRFG